MAQGDGAGGSLRDIDDVEDQVKDLIQGLYQVMVQVTQYDSAGVGKSNSSRDVIARELRSVSSSLQRIHLTTASPETRLPSVPTELIEYVENGRNPDIYTREFVELVRRDNQVMRGKHDAFASFRDVLAGEMRAAMPELGADVARVVAATTHVPASGTTAASGDKK